MNEMARIGAETGDEVRTKLTTAEFTRMIDCGAFDDLKVELVDGELQLMQYPHSNHATLQARVVVMLAQVVGERVCGEAGIPLSDDTALSCDAAVLKAPVTENRRFRPDDFALVIEIAETTLRRDLGMKRSKYAGAGIPFYWVVDGARSVVHVHADPIDGEYADVRTIRFGEPLAVPGTDATITLS